MSENQVAQCPRCPYRQKDREAATEGRSLVRSVVAAAGDTAARGEQGRIPSSAATPS